MVNSFSAVACSASGQTRAAKRTAQIEAAQDMNGELLETIFRSQFVLCNIIEQWLAFW